MSILYLPAEIKSGIVAKVLNIQIAEKPKELELSPILK